MSPTHPLDLDDLRRVELLLRAFEAAGMDRSSIPTTLALEYAHRHDELPLAVVGDRLLAREMFHTRIVLEAVTRALLTAAGSARLSRRGLMPVPVLPHVTRAPMTVCSVAGCHDLAVLWHCEHHDLERADREATS